MGYMEKFIYENSQNDHVRMMKWERNVGSMEGKKIHTEVGGRIVLI
jgi:hypothetical protein